MYRRQLSPGLTAFGFLSCLAAAVTHCLTLDAENPDLASALEGGLCCMRDLREKGHGPVKDAANGFPARRLAEVIGAATFRFSRAFFRSTDPATVAQSGSASSWSLLLQAQRGESNPAYDLARLVLLRGP
ncbi:MAG: hypothetical protein HGA93_05830, partial [Methanothrix sp.]|nr:hypothetical protein [Methanothrix sp.]